nr:helix-turn-helix domain-containing protein [Pseudomonas syringae]UVN17980.1 hypothetical protein pPsy0479b_00022 [Pseudomonas syringae]
MPPKYTNAGGQPRGKMHGRRLRAGQNYGATQATVATVMGCSQATVANWVKEVGFQKEISGLKGELTGAREYIDNLADQLNLIEYDPTDYED